MKKNKNTKSIKSIMNTKKKRTLLFDEDLFETNTEITDSAYTIHQSEFGYMIRQNGVFVAEVPTEEEAEEWIQNGLNDSEDDEMLEDDEEMLEDDEEMLEDNEEELLEDEELDPNYETPESDYELDNDSEIEEDVNEEFADSEEVHECFSSEEMSQIRTLLLGNEGMNDSEDEDEMLEDDEDELLEDDEEELLEDNEEELLEDDEEYEEIKDSKKKKMKKANDSFNSIYNRKRSSISLSDSEDKRQTDIKTAWEKR